MNYAYLRSTVLLGLLVGSGLLLAVFNNPEGSDIALICVAGLLFLESVRGEGFPQQGKSRAFLMSTMLVVLMLFAPLMLKDLESIARSTLKSIRADHPASQQFDSPKLANFHIPANATFSSYWPANELPRILNEGIALIKRHANKTARVASLVITDPFSFAIGLEPPKTTPLYWAVGYNFSIAHHPSAHAVLGGADFVIAGVLPELDQYQGYGAELKTPRLLENVLYACYLRNNFAERERTAHWRLLARKIGRDAENKCPA